MRIVVFYVYLCLLLLCGGHAVYAGTHPNSSPYSSNRGLAKKQQIKLSKTDQDSSVIEETDLDEESLSSHDAEDGGTDLFFTGKYNFSDNWYLTFSSLPILNYYNKRFNIIPPFRGQSSPIYIQQRVLRI